MSKPVIESNLRYDKLEDFGLTDESRFESSILEAGPDIFYSFASSLGIPSRAWISIGL